MPGQANRWSPAILAVIGGYALQAGLFALAFATTRATGDWQGALAATNMRLLVGGGLLLVMLGATWAAMARHRAKGARPAEFQLPLTMTLVSGFLCLFVMETGLRLLTVPDPLGRRLGNTILLPYEWDALARTNQEILARGNPDTAFYIADPRLGWVVGSSRASTDGLYVSSSEGLRSQRMGQQEAASRPDKRIALFGNSFAFSEEVAFSGSLAMQLEQELGGGDRVLNFGVPGYGVDQAALYFAHARSDWSPRVAILVFIEDDLVRSANVYTFLKTSWGLPLSKPRLVLRNEELELLNSPTLAGEALFERASIFELPFLDHEIEFTAERWRRHPLHASYLLRLLNGLLPPWPPKGEPVSEDAIVALNSRIIQDFERTARESGISPVIVYFPTDGDLNHGSRRVVKDRVLAELAANGVTVTDMTGCLTREIRQPELFMPGGHYTEQGNRAMARCLAPLVRTAHVGLEP